MNGARDFVQHISEITPPETNSKLGSLKMVSFWGNLKRPCFRCGVLLLVFREFLGEHPPQLWGHSSQDSPCPSFLALNSDSRDADATSQEKVLGLPVKSKNVYAIHVAAELADATMASWMQEKSPSFWVWVTAGPSVRCNICEGNGYLHLKVSY